MTAPDLFRRAAALGLRLEPRGDRLAVIPGSRLPAELADSLRQHKTELLMLLESRALGLPDDCAPWLHVSKQVLAGEFEPLDKSTAQTLSIGLRSIQHPLCRRALERLTAAKP